MPQFGSEIEEDKKIVKVKLLNRMLHIFRGIQKIISHTSALASEI